MKHAGPAAIARLDVLVAAIRTRPGLVEKRPGVFYRRGRAFLHFHEDPAGIFADLNDGADWLRMKVDAAGEPALLLAALDRVLAALTTGSR